MASVPTGRRSLTSVALIVACACLLQARAGASVSGAVERLVAGEHVRSTNSRIHDAISRGYARSRTFRDLVERLEESDVILHVERGDCSCRNARSCLVFLSDSGGVRYLRSLVSLQRNQHDLIQQIGHELFHASEIAAVPEVRNHAAFAQFYEQLRAARCESYGCYETSGAEQAELAVRAELLRRASPNRR